MTRPKVWLISSAVLAVALYGLLWLGTAQGWDWLAGIDSAALSAAYDVGARRPAWVTGWVVFCTVLGPMAFRLVALILVVVSAIRRNLRVAVFLLATVVLNGVLIETAKWLADRPRPDTALVSAMSTSFPSGHAVGVLLGVLALLTVAWSRSNRRAWVVGLGAVVVIAIGVGRVVLNVHHPSDVLAGWALGYAWYVVCLLVIRPERPVTEGGRTPAAHGIAP
ncbi:phosphatase PAP2 family protein [Mycolicibacterium thermoresistibile]